MGVRHHDLDLRTNELLLTDYLDGLRQPSSSTLRLHVNSCETLHAFGLSVSTHRQPSRAARVETPAALRLHILDATLGRRERSGWAAVRVWVRGLASPALCVWSVSVAATFLMLVMPPL